MGGRLGRLMDRIRGSQGDDWARYERRMPGFRERMLRAREELETGGGTSLRSDVFEDRPLPNGDRVLARDIWVDSTTVASNNS